MVDLPAPLGPTMPTRSPGADAEGQAGMGGAAAAGIGERDGVEADFGGQGGDRCAGWRGDVGVQQGVDAGRGRLAVHSLMQDAAQVTQRAEDLGSRHQDDEQRLQAHFAVLDAPGAEGEGGGGTHGGAEVGEAAGQHVQGEDPEGAVGERSGLGGEHAAVGSALPEGFQGGQALDGVEELLAERLERGLSHAGGSGGFAVNGGGEDQGEERGGEHDGGDRDVPPGDEQRKSRTARRWRW